MKTRVGLHTPRPAGWFQAGWVCWCAVRNTAVPGRGSPGVWMQSLSSPAFPVTPDRRIPFFTFASFPQTFCSYMMGVPYFNIQENEFLTLSEDCSPRGTRPGGNQHVLSAYCMLSGASLWLSSLWDPAHCAQAWSTFQKCHCPPDPPPLP